MPEFQIFGIDHIAVLLILFVVLILVILFRAQLTGSVDKTIRYLTAICLFLIGAVGLIAAYRIGVVVIPLNFCDLALFASIMALLTLKPWLCHVCYVWGLAGTMQALLQPDLSSAFPGFWWFHFFLLHGGVVLSAVYLAATQRVQPTLRTVGWLIVVTNLYAGIVITVNWFYGTNFGYLAQKPANPSILDYLGDWPYYLISMEIIGIVSMIVLFLPFSCFRRQFSRQSIT